MLLSKIQRTFFTIMATLMFLPCAYAEEGVTGNVAAKLHILWHNKLPAITVDPGEEKPIEYRQREVSLFYRSATGFEPLRLVRNQLTHEIRYAGPPEFWLYERKPAEAEGEEDQYIPRMNATIPVGGGEFFLVTNPMQQQNGVARMMPIPVDPDTIPKAHVFLFNMSPKPLRVATESGQKLQLAAMRGELIDLSGAKNDRLQVIAALSDQGEVEMIYRRYWRVKSGMRSVCLLYPANDESTHWSSTQFILD